MNFDALRSFLDVADTGSFSLAASRVKVSQSTVSTRISVLEEHLGVQLFRRSRGGVELTPAGHEFRPQAEQIVDLWNQARLRLALPKGYDAIFRLGGPVALQEWLSLSWILWMKQSAPSAALQLDAGTSDVLCDRLVMRRLDAAIMYLPQHRPGLVVEELYREHLVLVRHPDLKDDWAANYVAVDWGAEFTIQFSQAFPQAAAPTISVGVGALGLQYVFALKAAAYLPLSLLGDALREGRLARIEEAPVFQRPVYLVYPAQSRDAGLLDIATQGLRRLVRDHEAANSAQS
jgi:DNA-binding transcriptional LysR family regulator